MRILLGGHSGFCFGVRRAVEMAERLSALPGRRVYTCGRLIHNEQVLRALAARGVTAVEDPSALGPGDTLILRAHGVPPEVEAACRARGVTVADATCPFVKRIHRLVAQAAAQGVAALIAGSGSHPEVVGIRGYARAGAYVLERPEDAAALPRLERACLVAQTTLGRERYAEIAAAVRARVDVLTVHDTICDTTRPQGKSPYPLNPSPRRRQPSPQQPKRRQRRPNPRQPKRLWQPNPRRSRRARRSPLRPNPLPSPQRRPKQSSLRLIRRRNLPSSLRRLKRP